MDAIGPGDWVECIGALYGRETGFVFGALYLVSRVGIDINGPWLHCSGMPTPREVWPLEGGDGWTVEDFRPIRSDITSIERLLTEPLPADLVDA